MSAKTPRRVPMSRQLLVGAMICTTIFPGCIYRNAANLDVGKTPNSKCHQEFCNPDNCTTTVNLQCVPPPMPVVPDPQLTPAQVPLQLGIREAALMALSNNEVARIQNGNRDVMAARTIYDPRIANAERLAELGIFDTMIGGNLLFPHERNPPGLSFNGFATRPQRLDRGDFDLGITQKMRRGGTIGLNHRVNYLFVPGGPGINPQYQTFLEGSLTQPLLRGFGEVVTTAPIAIKASQANQSVWEFKRDMLSNVRAVEVAYWQLSAAQQRLRLIDETLPILGGMADKLEKRVDADRATRAQVARIRASYYDLAARRIEAVRIAQEKEQLLRNLLGMPPADGQYLVLTDEPILAPMTFDWQALVNVAVQQRPEVVRQRLAVHIANLQWKQAENAYLPQLDVFLSATPAGVDDELGSSWGMMFSAAHTSWNAGVLFEMPLQRTRERNNIRAAQLTVARERALLSQLGHQVVHELANTLRDISTLLSEYEVASNRLKYNDEWLRAAAATFDSPADARRYDQSFDRYLRAVESRLQAGERVVQLAELYNSSLVVLEEQKGTLLETLGMYVAGDPTQKANEKTMPNGLEELQDDQSDLGPVHVEPEFAYQGKPATALPGGPPQVAVSPEYAPQPVVIPQPPAPGYEQAAPQPPVPPAPAARMAQRPLTGPIAPPPVHVAPTYELAPAPPAAGPMADPLGPPPVHVAPTADLPMGPMGPVTRMPATTPSPQANHPLDLPPSAGPQPAVEPGVVPTAPQQLPPTADPQGPPPVHVSPEAGYAP